MIAPIRKTIDVTCDPETAFSIFTEKIADWWPLEANSISAMSGKPARSLTLEPRVGGQVYETTAEGKREDWARVTAFEPGRRLALAWHVMSPPDKATDVEIVFSPSDGGTRVDLTHAGWEILEDGAADSRNGYDSGWVRVFEERFAGACAA